MSNFSLKVVLSLLLPLETPYKQRSMVIIVQSDPRIDYSLTSIYLIPFRKAVAIT